MWKFDPIFKSTIWGGEKIAPFKHTVTDQAQIGESWEISGVPGSESIVADGPDKGLSLSQLLEKYGKSLLGERNYKRFGNRFPLLIKFIDAAADLSVQVHPDDALAQRRGEANGKTEMWYVIDADKEARLANGFKNPVDPADYEGLVESGRIEEVLNFVDIRPGDTFFIPAGRVHAIGAGSFVAEIQQTSDVTYRIYDYHRKDKNGNERQLHTELAKEAINFNDTDGDPVEYTEHPDIPVNLVRTPFFSTNVLEIDSEVMRDYSECDTFVILIAVKGEAEIACGRQTMTLRGGETLLVPASASGITINPKGNGFRALESYIA